MENGLGLLALWVGIWGCRGSSNGERSMSRIWGHCGLEFGVTTTESGIERWEGVIEVGWDVAGNSLELVAALVFLDLMEFSDEEDD
ncbi:unnamed protein product [Linum trigynum]|uniref:Uncharacterized protein n=1 Tax=Linum trigynum TaxID=586398 RepID=A0AAV2CAE2_9ROSI